MAPDEDDRATEDEAAPAQDAAPVRAAAGGADKTEGGEAEPGAAAVWVLASEKPLRSVHLQRKRVPLFRGHSGQLTTTFVS